MDVNLYLLLALLATLLVIAYLLTRLHRVRGQLSLIKDALMDIKSGNLNRRVLVRESDMTKQICYDINEIAMSSQSRLIQRQFHVTDYAVQDEHNLRLYDTALDMAAINKALVVQDVAVISSQICNDTLEDYFKQITGGEGIA